MKKLYIIMHFKKKLYFDLFCFFFVLYLFLCFGFFLYLEIKLNIISLNHTISQVLQPRKRLILRGSCPRSRLGTSDIHSHSYSIGSTPPSNSMFDIIVDPRWIVDCGSYFGNVSSACIINSVLDNFKS